LHLLKPLRYIIKKQNKSVIQVLEKLNSKLIAVEKNYFGCEQSERKSFKKIDRFWVQESKNLFVLYQSLKNLPGIEILPARNLKKWLRWSFESLLGKKKKKYTLSKLLGPVFGWYLLNKKACFNTNATLIIEHSSTVLVYRSPQVCVIKIAHSKKSLVESLHKEFNVIQDLSKMEIGIQVPKILKNGLDFIYPYLVQNLIEGKTLYQSKHRNSRKVWIPVFQFLKKWYLSQQIEEVIPNYNLDSKEFECLNHFLIHNFPFDKWMLTLQRIYASNKKLISCNIHGDLGTGNIIIDNKAKIWIIDWGATGKNYIVRDLDKSFYRDALAFYEDIAIKVSKNTTDLYPYREQLLINKIEFIALKLNNYDCDKLNKESIDYFNRLLLAAFKEYSN